MNLGSPSWLSVSGVRRQAALDSDILHWIEEHDFLLVTNNRHSMPGHLHDHLASNRHIPGILVVPTTNDIGMLIEVLRLVWGASFADEYRDKITYLPFI